MAITKYISNGKEFYKVFVKTRGEMGDQISKCKSKISSKVQAQRIEAKLRTQLEIEKGNKCYYTWANYVHICIKKMKLEFKPSTTINYEKTLKKWTFSYFGNKEIAKITKEDIHDLIYNHIQGVSDTTRKGILKKVRRIFNMAIEERILTRNPTIGLKVKATQAKKKCFNSEEIKILLSNAYKIKHPYYEVWVVALLTGMRSGELYSLLWSDICLESNYINVNKSWSSKNGTGSTKNSLHRSIPISSELKQFLTQIKLKSTSSYVLPRLNSWYKGEQAKILRKFCEILGITIINFHDLRATFITQMLINNVPISKVMKIVGHADLKTTMCYLRIIAKDTEGATEALPITLPKYSEKENIVHFS